MDIQHVAIEAIKPYANNPRQHSAVAIDKVAQSIKDFGWQQPIVVDKKYVIIAGHTRFKAAQQLGLTQVPVLIAEQLSPAQAASFRLADNRTHEEGEWDEALLARALRNLNIGNANLNCTGFSSNEIDDLLNSLKQLEHDPPDENACPELAEEPQTKAGDIWCLDKHRVMCGDAVCTEHLSQLMQNDKADMVFTDPPYNVDYCGYTKDQLTLKQDNLAIPEFPTLAPTILKKRLLIN